MCQFCDKISTEWDYKTKDPYLYRENKLYQIIIPTDEGIDYLVEEIKFCPYCGRKLHRRKNKSNVRDVIIALSAELQKHTYLYDAFCDSILSAIKENTVRYDDEREDDIKLNGIDEYGMAEKILKRIVGEE